jgi:Fe2+ or Zn2+ uptake regulation protein
MQQHDQRMEDVAMEIARYLCANPDAGDTAEGVRHWWLTGDNAKVALNVVYAALNELLLQGAVKMRESADGTRIYSGRVGGQCE